MTAWRRVLASANLLIVLALLWFLFVMVNYLGSRRYARWDLTKQKITVLSDKTVQTLRALQTPLNVIVFYQPTQRLYELVKDQLAEYARVSPQIHVEYVDPEQDRARAVQLAQQFAIKDLNVVIFQAGTRHKYLSDTDLAEYDYGDSTMTGPSVKAFKGEEAFTSAIISVTQDASPVVWCSSGHDEKSLEEPGGSGASELKKALEQQNMTIRSVALLGEKEIPLDVKLVIIAGPTRRFTESEAGLLQAYLDRGGRLLALLDPLVDSGLDGLLERWGIILAPDVVVDPSQQLPFVSAANLLVTTYTEHPIVRKMKTLVTLFPLARSVRPAAPAPEGFTVSGLALTTGAGWGETTTSSETFQFDEGQDLKGPVPIAAACERNAPARTRLVVIGDSDFAINGQLGNVGNQDFLLGAVHWLIEQEQLIGIGPKALDAIQLHLTGGQLTGIFWFSFLALPMGCALLGVGVWWLRRQ